MFNRLAGFAALGFVIIVLSTNIALEAGEPPASDAAPPVVAAYFANHSTAVEYGVAFAALAWLLICIFGAGAVIKIGRIERDRAEGWSTVGLLGIAMLTVMFSAVAATRLALTAGPPAGDVTTGALWHLHNACFTLNSMSLVVVLTGFSIGGLRTSTLRPWHASIGLLSATLLFAGVVVGAFTAGAGQAGVSLIGFIGWLLWLVWLGTFGIVLIRHTTHRTLVQSNT